MGGGCGSGGGGSKVWGRNELMLLAVVLILKVLLVLYRGPRNSDTLFYILIFNIKLYNISPKTFYHNSQHHNSKYKYIV